MKQWIMFSILVFVYVVVHTGLSYLRSLFLTAACYWMLFLVNPFTLVARLWSQNFTFLIDAICVAADRLSPFFCVFGLYIFTQSFLKQSFNTVRRLPKDLTL
jgi:hypothetical protein